MLQCAGSRCRVARHTFCCTPPLASLPPGDWLCDGCIARQAGSFRQQLTQAQRVSKAAQKPPCWRVPLEEREPTAEPQQEAQRREGDDGVWCLRLAMLAPELEFDRELQQGTIFNHEKVRLAGALYDADTGYAIKGTELQAHPDPKTLSKVDKLPARVLTDANVDEDLSAPRLAPPQKGAASSWRVQAAGEEARVICKVLYLPLDSPIDGANGSGSTAGAAEAEEEDDDVPSGQRRSMRHAKRQRKGTGGHSDAAPVEDVRGLGAAAVRAVARALDAGDYTDDEKTGGGYAVAGNGCMATAPPPPMVHSTRSDGNPQPHIIPYTRVDTSKPLVQEAVADAAPLMGYVAEKIGQVFPETTTGLAAAVRRHPVVGDTFMCPSHEQQRKGLPANDGDAGSICAHQLAMRLAGELPSHRNLRKRARHQHCALHLDTDDARRPHGSPLVYALLCEEGVQLDGERAERPMKASDLVVFEHGSGGRCVRIQTACPDHVCVVILASDQHLHCNVFPDSLEVPTTPGVALLRLVPYGRQGIDDFCAAVQRQPELWEEAKSQLDDRLAARAVAVEAP